MIQCRDYQLKAVDATSQNWRAGRKRVVLVSPTGSGKCLGAGTPVLMFDGTIKAVEDVRIGELVMGPDSAPRAVLSLARGREAMYRITPTKGDPYTVNESHILSLKMTPDGKDRLGGTVVNLSVRDYLKRSNTFRHRAKCWRAAVDWAHTPVPIDPYYLGLWLADGSTSSGTIIHKPDAEVEEFLASFAAEFGLKLKNIGGRKRCPAWSITTGIRGGNNTLQNAMRDLGVVNSKHVPREYLANSRQVRLALLAGMLDGDGHLTNKGYEYSSVRECLADAVVFLCRSLGLAAYKAGRHTRCQTGASCYSFRVSISGKTDMVPCRIARKQSAPRRQIKDVTVYGFTVEPLGEGDYYGFEVDGDRLFVLGDFTVTHNSTVACEIMRRATTNGRRVLFLAHRRRLIQQIAERAELFGIDYGVVMADLPDAPWVRNNPGGLLQIASRDTLLSLASASGWGGLPKSDLLIVDECHGLESRQYKMLAEACGAPFWVGLTATPVRPDGTGLGADTWDTIVEAATVPELVDRKFLVPVKVFAPPGVGERRKRGDKTPIAGDPVDHWQRYAAGMPTVVFTRTVAESVAVRDRYRAAGVAAAHIDASTSYEERERIIADTEAGRNTVITNAAVLIEGVDIPCLGCCQLLSRNGSIIALLQKVGRVMRPHPGKEYAVLLDHSGAVFEHGMPGEPIEWSLSESNLDQRMKKDREAGKRADPILCGKCGLIFAGAPVCPECGAPVPRRKPKGIDTKLANERLVQVAGAGGSAERDRLQREWTRTLYMARAKGKTSGWAVSVFKSKFGEYPHRCGLTPAFSYEHKDTPVAQLLTGGAV
jgi:superfamily II DNA or RNA helicase